jgi:elongation factor Ts
MAWHGGKALAEVGAELVKGLRERTGAGIMDCKRALQATGGDADKAVDWLREKGLARAAQKAGRAASEGLVTAYVHAGGRVGVLIEVNCETDFVARTEEFRALAHDLAMQVAASSPRWVRVEDVPPEVVAHEREVLARQAAAEGKPERVLAQMVEGRLRKFYAENCLMAQPFIKDGERTVEAVVKEAIARLGENIVPRRFARFELGAGSVAAADGLAAATTGEAAGG